MAHRIPDFDMDIDHMSTRSSYGGLKYMTKVMGRHSAAQLRNSLGPYADVFEDFSDDEL